MSHLPTDRPTRVNFQAHTEIARLDAYAMAGPGERPDLIQANSDIEAEGAIVLGVSTDSLHSHEKFRQKHNLSFPLLSDPDHSTIEAWGAWGEKVRGGRTSIGLIRSSFLVDEDGRIEGVWSPVKPEDTVPNALAALA